MVHDIEQVELPTAVSIAADYLNGRACEAVRQFYFRQCWITNTPFVVQTNDENLNLRVELELLTLPQNCSTSEKEASLQFLSQLWSSFNVWQKKFSQAIQSVQSV